MLVFLGEIRPFGSKKQSGCRDAFPILTLFKRHNIKKEEQKRKNRKEKKIRKRIKKCLDKTACIFTHPTYYFLTFSSIFSSFFIFFFLGDSFLFLKNPIIIYIKPFTAPSFFPLEKLDSFFFFPPVILCILLVFRVRFYKNFRDFYVVSITKIMIFNDNL